MKRAFVVAAISLLGFSIGGFAQGTAASATVDSAADVRGNGHHPFPEKITDCIFTPPANAKGKSYGPAASQDKPSETHDLCIDVRTLDTNDTRMYWKQTDSIRIVLFNNPFIFRYKVDVNEQAIQDDDVLGKLGPLLGLSKDAIAAKPSTPGNKLDIGPVFAYDANVQVHSIRELSGREPVPCLEAALSSAIEKFSQARSGDLQERLNKKQTQYDVFVSAYLDDLARIEDPSRNLREVWDSAVALRKMALASSQELVGEFAFENDIVQRARAFAELKSELNRVALCNPSDNADALQQGKNENKADFERRRQQVKSDFAAKVKQASEDLAKMDTVVSPLAHTACVYEARKTGEFAWVNSRVYEPLSKILGNPDNNPFRREIRVGPYEDPTDVGITLKRNSIVDETSATIPVTGNATFSCSSDVTALLNSAGSASTVEDLLPKNAISRDNPPAGNKDTTQAKGADDTEATTVRLKQPLIFGTSRIVVTGGLTTGILRKQEFQRSTSISGGQSQTVIGLKTDSLFRVAPMLYGHVRLHEEDHHSEAWYATLGVTANSDNKGTSPEFLLGLSRSLLQQRFFATAGVYLGQQQRLDGGLHVGDVIPSSFTGELPVTKSYRPGFAFAISFRFAKPKDTTTNTPTQPAKKGAPKK